MIMEKKSEKNNIKYINENKLNIIFLKFLSFFKFITIILLYK